MLRTALISAALIAATLSPAARGSDYVEAHVVSVVPHLALSFGSLRHDGFRVDYEIGGHRYATHSHRHPGRVILVPPPFRVVPVPPSFRRGHDHDDHRHDWKDRGRWDDRRHWRNDDHGHDRGRGRKHGRH